MTDVVFALDAAEVARFHDEGYLVVDPLTDPEELVALRPAYDRLFGEGAVAAKHRIELSGTDLPQVLDAERYAPELGETAAFRNASDRGSPAARPRRRSPPACTRSGSPRRTGAETPWHQDEAYWDPARDHFAISVWIPLQPVTEDNGCMQFQPASNRLPVLDHQRVDPATEGLVLVDPSARDRAGRLPATARRRDRARQPHLHYTGPNRSDEPRRALIMSFASPSRARVEPRSFPWQRSHRSD